MYSDSRGERGGPADEEAPVLCETCLSHTRARAYGHSHRQRASGEREVTMPIRAPWLSRRGPPELPGLMAASVWITFEIVLPIVVHSKVD